MEKRIKRRRRIFNHFPAEIVEGILYELPVKSLLRFKCVSKSWRCSISSRGFMTEHLKKSNNTGTDFAHHNLLFRLCHQSNHVIPGLDFLPVERFIKLKCVGSCCIGPLLSDNNDEPNPNCLGSDQSIPIPASEDASDIYLLGSCNGLILIDINHRELYLWNPSTRKAKNILNASFPKETSTWKKERHDSGCGFGYNELTDDYKVVCTFHNRSLPEGQMLMYSSRTNSWKTILNFNKGRFVHGPAKFVNGRLYWLRLDVEDDFALRWDMASLDLVEEEDKYRIIAPPPRCAYSDGDYRLWPVLAELGGYLSFIYYNSIHRNQSTMDVWVMKKESWSKIWTFSGQVDRLPMPIWLKKNGDIVVTSRSDLVIYRGKDKLHQSLVDNMIRFRLDSIVYVESLVQPISNDRKLPQ